MIVSVSTDICWTVGESYRLALQPHKAVVAVRGCLRGSAGSVSLSRTGAFYQAPKASPTRLGSSESLFEEMEAAGNAGTDDDKWSLGDEEQYDLHSIP